jgi:hypothetical protein
MRFFRAPVMWFDPHQCLVVSGGIVILQGETPLMHGQFPALVSVEMAGGRHFQRRRWTTESALSVVKFCLAIRSVGVQSEEKIRSSRHCFLFVVSALRLPNGASAVARCLDWGLAS